jgi:hypothetical protein
LQPATLAGFFLLCKQLFGAMEKIFGLSVLKRIENQLYLISVNTAILRSVFLSPKEPVALRHYTQTQAHTCFDMNWLMRL